MITRISFENFKGIRERVEIELRPLTLLFGANSAGKSSILQALIYAREIFDHHNLNVDFTDSGGASVDLGGFRRMVHAMDSQRSVTLCFELDIANSSLDPYVETFDRISEFVCLPIETLITQPRQASIAIEVALSHFYDEVFVRRYEVSFDGVHFATLLHDPERKVTSITELNAAHPTLVRPRAALSLEPSANEVEAMEMLHSDLDRSFLDTCLEYIRELFQFTGDDSIPLEGVLDALPDLNQLLLPAVDLGQSTQPSDQRIIQDGVFEEVRIGLTQLIVGPARILRDCLRELTYLGPIRTVPPRDYAPPKTPDPSRWASGLGAWDRLETADSAFIDAVSDWLGDENRLNSGYRLRLKRFKELDLSDPLVVQLLTGRAFDDVEAGSKLDLDKLPTQTRVLIVPVDGSIELRPNDVGIGISQVVPVIVTALDGSGKLVAIEQPELHIHPRLQAEIADLFLEAGQKQGHRFLIETHSEHLILRLLRRIRETENGKAPVNRQLRTDDLAIYYLKQEGGTTLASRIDVDVKGEFIQPWPDDFFEIDFYERFA